MEQFKSLSRLLFNFVASKVTVSATNVPVVHLGQSFKHALLFHEPDQALILLFRPIANVNLIGLAQAGTLIHETANLSRFTNNQSSYPTLDNKIIITFLGRRSVSETTLPKQRAGVLNKRAPTYDELEKKEKTIHLNSFSWPT